MTVCHHTSRIRQPIVPVGLALLREVEAQQQTAAIPAPGKEQPVMAPYRRMGEAGPLLAIRLAATRWMVGKRTTGTPLLKYCQWGVQSMAAMGLALRSARTAGQESAMEVSALLHQLGRTV